MYTYSLIVLEVSSTEKEFTYHKDLCVINCSIQNKYDEIVNVLISFHMKKQGLLLGMNIGGVY